jgi:alpha-1,2-mannosyltransferase
MLLATVVLGVIGYDAVRSWGQRLLDVEVYKQGARLWLAGHDLYTSADLPIDLPFLYPPFAAVLFSPLAEQSPQASGSWITVLSFAALLTVAVLLARRLGERFGPWPITAAVMVALAMQLEPVQQTFGFGQINLILLALVLADCLIEVRWWPRGALVGLAAAIKLTPLVFLLYFLLRRDLRAAVVATASFAGCLAVGFIAAPRDSATYWTGVVFDTADRVGSDYVGNQSIYGMLSRATGLTDTGVNVLWALGSAVVLAAGGVVMWCAIRRGQHLAAVAVCGMLGVLVSPISWSHHWVWIVPAVAAVLGFASWRLLVPTIVAIGVFVAGPHWQLPAGNGQEAAWTAGEWILGNAYLLTALVVLAAVTVADVVQGWRRDAGVSAPTPPGVNSHRAGPAKS